MAGWILLAIFAVIAVRIAIIFLLPGLDDFLAGGNNVQEDDYMKSRYKNDPYDYLAPNDSSNITQGAEWNSALYSKDIGNFDD